MKRVIVVPYDESWKAEFERIKEELLAVLIDYAMAIEHVGSTSVPELYAKPIIDVDIVIDEKMFDTIKAQLGDIGYTHIGDLGVEGREAFKYENKPHLLEHHLYVCNKNADELERHLALRNFLRSNGEYRNKYSELKIKLAKMYPYDIDSYINGKQSLILEIYEKCGLDIPYKQSKE